MWRMLTRRRFEGSLQARPDWTSIVYLPTYLRFAVQMAQLESERGEL